MYHTINYIFMEANFKCTGVVDVTGLLFLLSSTGGNINLSTDFEACKNTTTLTQTFNQHILS